MKSRPFLLLGALLLACGGSTVTISDAGPGSDASMGGDGGSGSGSGGTSGSSSSGSSSGSGSGSGGSSGGSSSGGSSGGSSGSSSGGSSCDALMSQINALRPGAEACCPTCNHAPCTFVVDDLCCPLTVDMQASTGVVAFENAVTQYKAEGCMSACPAISCPTAPSGNCDPSTSLCR